MTDYEKMTEYELYIKAKRMLTRELTGERVVTFRGEVLYKVCMQRNPRIWEKAFEDANLISMSVEDKFSRYEVNNTNDTRVLEINRIDFCNPTELSKVLGTGKRDLKSVIRLVSTDYFASKVEGSSMKDARIYPGDTVLIEKTNKIKDGSIVVIQIRNKQLIKRLTYVDDGIILKSDNPKYEPMFVPFGGPTPFGIVQYCILKVE